MISDNEATPSAPVAPTVSAPVTEPPAAAPPSPSTTPPPAAPKPPLGLRRNPSGQSSSTRAYGIERSFLGTHIPSTIDRMVNAKVWKLVRPPWQGAPQITATYASA